MAAEFSCFCNYLALTLCLSIVQPSIVVYATNLFINLLIWFVQFVNSCSCWSSVVQSKLLMVRWFISFVRVVQFNQSVSCSSSAVHGSFRQFGSSYRLIAGSVGSVVQSVRSVCTFTVADQHSPAQITKHDSRMLEYFTNNARSLYSVKIFYQPIYIST